MLSILIPTYNYDCTQLVADLQQQAEQIGINYEIIVADDAEVAIYTFAGKLVTKGTAGEYTLPAGNYIVKVGNKAVKVNL